MEGYDVVANDDHKIGHVVGTENGYLIVESGMLRKSKHAVPLDMARTDDDVRVVRLTVSKEMVTEGPAVEDGGWQAVDDYYGRSAELEGQAAADIPQADQQRAEMRESSPGSSLSAARNSAASSLFAVGCLRLSMRATHRARSGPTEVARTSTDERRTPSLSSYSLVYTYPTTTTGSPFPRAAPTPVTSLPQQFTVTKNEFPGSQLPSAVRRRELLATRNLKSS